MKKVYFKCWLNKNLGDDLFLKIISDRYKNNLYARTIVPYKKMTNVHFLYINEFVYKVFDKLASLFHTFNLIDKFFVLKTDLTLVVGGSIFMESKSPNRRLESYWYDNIDKDYYIIGSNIGPVFTQEYIDDLKNKVFARAQLVSLRDKTSYELVADCSNVQYSSDIVFSLNVESLKSVSVEKKVIISVIDCYKKASQTKNVNPAKYDDLILEIISNFIERGYVVELMSFCKYEGDEIAIDRLMRKFGQNSRLIKYFYDGNIDDALLHLATSEFIVGTRFHANILGFLLNKKVVPISYNDKTVNMLHDIDFNGVFIDLNDIRKIDYDKIFDINNNFCVNIDRFRKSSLNHFKELDKILVKRWYDER